MLLVYLGLKHLSVCTSALCCCWLGSSAKAACCSQPPELLLLGAVGLWGSSLQGVLAEYATQHVLPVSREPVEMMS